MTPIEIKFLISIVGILLSLLAFIGGLGVKAIIKISRDLNEIKTTIAKIDEKHNNFEVTIKHHDKRTEKIEDKIFI